MKVVRYIKKDGKWIADNKGSLENKNKYLRALPNGSEIIVTYEVDKELKTLKQLRIIHAYISEIVRETGQDHKQIKDSIKEKTQLRNKDGSYKSFKDCTKEEMSQAIMNTIELAEWLNINLENFDLD